MISCTDKRLDSINERYKKHFGEIIPLMMVPPLITIEELSDIVDESIREGRDLLPERFNWENDVLY